MISKVGINKYLYLVRAGDKANLCRAESGE